MTYWRPDPERSAQGVLPVASRVKLTQVWVRLIESTRTQFELDQQKRFESFVSVKSCRQVFLCCLN